MTPQLDYSEIQDDVLAYLSSLPFFGTVFLFAVRPGNLQTQIDQALSGLKKTNGKCGASIEIGKPFLVDPLANSPGPTADIEMRFLIKVQPTINNGLNGTGYPCETISSQLIRSLLGWASEGAQSGVFFPAADLLTPAHFGDGAPFEGHLAKMRARVTLPPLDRTLDPQMAENAGSVTITCADAGAVILFTVDGSTPGYNQGTTQTTAGTLVYVNPFVVASGSVIRAMAIAPNKLPSIINYTYVN